MIRQQKLETRQVREEVKKLKERRTRLNGDARNKPEQRTLTNQIKELEEQMEAKHALELEEYDKKHPSESKAPANSMDGKLDFKSINLNFGHIKFDV